MVRLELEVTLGVSAAATRSRSSLENSRSKLRLSGNATRPLSFFYVLSLVDSKDTDTHSRLPRNNRTECLLIFNDAVSQIDDLYKKKWRARCGQTFRGPPPSPPKKCRPSHSILCRCFSSPGSNRTVPHVTQRREYRKRLFCGRLFGRIFSGNTARLMRVCVLWKPIYPLSSPPPHSPQPPPCIVSRKQPSKGKEVLQRRIRQRSRHLAYLIINPLPPSCINIYIKGIIKWIQRPKIQNIQHKKSWRYVMTFPSPVLDHCPRD